MGYFKRLVTVNPDLLDYDEDEFVDEFENELEPSDY